VTKAGQLKSNKKIKKKTNKNIIDLGNGLVQVVDNKGTLLATMHKTTLQKIKNLDTGTDADKNRLDYLHKRLKELEDKKDKRITKLGVREMTALRGNITNDLIMQLLSSMTKETVAEIEAITGRPFLS